MNKIVFLRNGIAMALALVIHLAAFYGVAAATPLPRHGAGIVIGPVVGVAVVKRHSLFAVSPVIANQAS
jgi:hypothetical protein